MPRITQKDKVLKAFKEAEGKPVSSRYLKQVLFISECNGRISELRAGGYEIETLPDRDEHGFALHVLKSSPKVRRSRFEPVMVAGVRTMREIVTYE